MRFFTPDEARDWALACGVSIPSGRSTPEHEPGHLQFVRFLLPQTPGQVPWLARFLSECLSPRDSCLMWVTEWGVWPSSENWHLYYRFRQSYGDGRLLKEAPGHLFLDYEQADLMSFLQLGIVSGWDIHLLPTLQYGGPDAARVFCSHDEWIVLGHHDPDVVEKWTATLRGAEYRIIKAEVA